MPALSDLVVYIKAQKPEPTEIQVAAQNVLYSLMLIHDTVVYQMKAINALCEKYGLEAILNELPEEQQNQLKDTMAVIQTAWTEIGSDPVPELPVTPKVQADPTENIVGS